MTRDFDSYSQLQLSILKWMFAPSAIVSAISSACLLRLILFAADACHQQKTYHRLLLGISVIDIMSSTSLVVFSALIYGPDVEPGPLCTTDGAIKVFGIGSSIYMACLSVYFLLIIRYSVPDRKIVTRYEIWFHLISLLWPLSAVIWGFVDRVFNPYAPDLGCKIQEFPIGCLKDDKSSCERGGMFSIIHLLGAVLPFSGVFFVLISTNVLIFLTVRRTEARARQYDFARYLPIQQMTMTTERRARQLSKTKRVAAQSFFFVSGYFLTYTPSALLFAVKIADLNGLQEAKYFVLQVMFGVTWPLQGFFDFLVYVRPRYLQYRRHNSEWSRWKCFMVAGFSLTHFPDADSNNNENTQALRSSSIVRFNHNNNHDLQPNNRFVSAVEGDDLEMPSRIFAAASAGERGSFSTQEGKWDDEL